MPSKPRRQSLSRGGSDPGHRLRPAARRKPLPDRFHRAPARRRLRSHRRSHRLHHDQRPRSRRRAAHPRRSASAQATRPHRAAGKRHILEAQPRWPAQRNRSCPAQDRRERSAHARPARATAAPRRPAGIRHRQSRRLAKFRHHGSGQRRRPPGRSRQAPHLYPDRCSHQPRQQRRPARRYERLSRWASTLSFFRKAEAAKAWASPSPPASSISSTTACANTATFIASEIGAVAQEITPDPRRWPPSRRSAGESSSPT